MGLRRSFYESGQTAFHNRFPALKVRSLLVSYFHSYGYLQFIRSYFFLWSWYFWCFWPTSSSFWCGCSDRDPMTDWRSWSHHHHPSPPASVHPHPRFPHRHDRTPRLPGRSGDGPDSTWHHHHHGPPARTVRNSCGWLRCSNAGQVFGPFFVLSSHFIRLGGPDWAHSGCFAKITRRSCFGNLWCCCSEGP